MHKGIVAYIAIIIIVLIIWYIATGFKTSPTTTTTTITSKTTATTTIPGNTASTGNNTTGIYYPCSNFALYNSSNNADVSGKCFWNGGPLGFWVAAGNPGSEHATITGPLNVTYVNQTSSSSCITFYQNFTAPEGVYTMTMHTGPGGGSCGYSIAKLNSTTVPPPQTYNFVFNGDFHTGSYAGWNVTGKGFGTKPSNITYDDAMRCYLGQPWSGYNSTFFATTYNCGLTNAPGNLTSSPFYASNSFLNFKIISPANSGLYVEILLHGTPVIIAHYNTYNTTFGSSSSYTFRNASIPLTTVIGEPIQIRVVAATLTQQRFIAVQDFMLSSTPNQQPGILVNLTEAQ
jgi:hypothetical protein